MSESLDNKELVAVGHEFAKAVLQQQDITKVLDECSEYLGRDCIMETNDISYEVAAQREVGAKALHYALVGLSRKELAA